ncbi:MAG: peptidase M64 [Bacteroidaceae bacterium]|nr:peptidase M64 [Bacteroidaceae bacterium]
MKKLLSLCLLALFSLSAAAQRGFAEHFENATLRLDYIFGGDAKQQWIALDEQVRYDGWAGRRSRLTELPMLGNGQIEMRDAATGQLLYVHSFSTLFQEWLVTEEAAQKTRSFENVFQLPFPKSDVRVTVKLIDARQQVICSNEQEIKVKDILIRRLPNAPKHDFRYLLQSGRAEQCIDVAILAEGYTEDELDEFYRDAQVACDEIFKYAPFAQLRDRFNLVAVAAKSQDSGVSVPRANDWRRTAFSAHFDTFYSDRYLTTLQLKALNNALQGIPYEHIIVLANTKEYGGGGIYNSYTLTTAKHPLFKPVVVHEFGHSFAGLGDEYATDDEFAELFPHDIEPWEANITTLVNFASKWQDMLPKGRTIEQVKVRSTDRSKAIGLYEGAGYQTKGVYRAFPDCRMRTNVATTFCAVCQRHIDRLIKFYTDAADQNP